jgi:ribosomal protein L7/L12
MMILYAVVAIVAVALIVNAANRSGKIQLPSPGQGTDADVERLVAAGRKIDAIKVYRRIHQTDLKTAKDAVDRLAERPDLRGG